ncbi:hypothetical protein [Deinococcus sp. UYEF24]
MTQASGTDPSSAPTPLSVQPETTTPAIQTQISDRPEPMALWLAWLLLTLLVILAAFTLYLYVTTQYVPER